jgi:hypothetical protein
MGNNEEKRLNGDVEGSEAGGAGRATTRRRGRGVSTSEGEAVIEALIGLRGPGAWFRKNSGVNTNLAGETGVTAWFETARAGRGEFCGSIWRGCGVVERGDGSE